MVSVGLPLIMINLEFTIYGYVVTAVNILISNHPNVYMMSLW